VWGRVDEDGKGDAMTTNDRLKVLACRIVMAMALTQAQAQQLGSQRQLGVHRWLVADAALHDKPARELAAMYVEAMFSV